ncbi:hypothetical protein M917_0571 [Psychrobacter aquaticus CMS 56]|uniref:Uncharacterized protein n=1 Tax=Psychrobacter aquaticus CMS 56 TaxID=1354303 RepID=U4T6M8_9GAMM|nr:hypothetical protein M917_0571 [Psychrobacter aquaticus CMS 56]
MTKNCLIVPTQSILLNLLSAPNTNRLPVLSRYFHPFKT